MYAVLNVVKVLCLVQIVFNPLFSQVVSQDPQPRVQKFCFFASSELIYENVMKQVAASAACEGGGKLLDNKVSLGGVQGVVEDYDSIHGAVYLVNEIDYQSILKYAQSRSQLSYMSQARVVLNTARTPSVCRTIDIGIISSGFPFSTENEIAFETSVAQYVERLRQLGAAEKYLRKLTNAQKWMPASCGSSNLLPRPTPQNSKKRRVTSKIMKQRTSKAATSNLLAPAGEKDTFEQEEPLVPRKTRNYSVPSVNHIKVETIKQDGRGVTKITTQKQEPGMQPTQEIRTVSNEGAVTGTLLSNNQISQGKIPNLVKELQRPTLPNDKSPTIDDPQPYGLQPFAQKDNLPESLRQQTPTGITKEIHNPRNFKLLSLQNLTPESSSQPESMLPKDTVFNPQISPKSIQLKNIQEETLEEMTRTRFDKPYSLKNQINPSEVDSQTTAKSEDKTDPISPQEKVHKTVIPNTKEEEIENNGGPPTLPSNLTPLQESLREFSRPEDNMPPTEKLDVQPTLPLKKFDKNTPEMMEKGTEKSECPEQPSDVTPLQETPREFSKSEDMLPTTKTRDDLQLSPKTTHLQQNTPVEKFEEVSEGDPKPLSMQTNPSELYSQRPLVDKDMVPAHEQCGQPPPSVAKFDKNIPTVVEEELENNSGPKQPSNLTPLQESPGEFSKPEDNMPPTEKVNGQTTLPLKKFDKNIPEMIEKETEKSECPKQPADVTPLRETPREFSKPEDMLPTTKTRDDLQLSPKTTHLQQNTPVEKLEEVSEGNPKPLSMQTNPSELYSQRPLVDKDMVPAHEQCGQPPPSVAKFDKNIPTVVEEELENNGGPKQPSNLTPLQESPGEFSKPEDNMPPTEKVNGQPTLPLKKFDKNMPEMIEKEIEKSECPKQPSDVTPLRETPREFSKPEEEILFEDKMFGQPTPPSEQFHKNIHENMEEENEKNGNHRPTSNMTPMQEITQGVPKQEYNMPPTGRMIGQRNLPQKEFDKNTPEMVEEEFKKNGGFRQPTNMTPMQESSIEFSKPKDTLPTDELDSQSTPSQKKFDKNYPNMVKEEIEKNRSIRPTSNMTPTQENPEFSKPEDMLPATKTQENLQLSRKTTHLQQNTPVEKLEEVSERDQKPLSMQTNPSELYSQRPLVDKDMVPAHEQCGQPPPSVAKFDKNIPTVVEEELENNGGPKQPSNLTPLQESPGEFSKPEDNMPPTEKLDVQPTLPLKKFDKNMPEMMEKGTEKSECSKQPSDVTPLRETPREFSKPEEEILPEDKMFGQPTPPPKQFHKNIPTVVEEETENNGIPKRPSDLTPLHESLQEFSKPEDTLPSAIVRDKRSNSSPQSTSLQNLPEEILEEVDNPRNVKPLSLQNSPPKLCTESPIEVGKPLSSDKVFGLRIPSRRKSNFKTREILNEENKNAVDHVQSSNLMELQDNHRSMPTPLQSTTKLISTEVSNLQFPNKPSALQNDDLFKSHVQQFEEQSKKVVQNADKTIMEVLISPKQGSSPTGTTTTVISKDGNPPTILINGQPVTPSQCSQISNTMSPTMPDIKTLDPKQKLNSVNIGPTNLPEELLEENRDLLNNIPPSIPKEFSNLESQSSTTFHSEQAESQRLTNMEKTMKSGQLSEDTAETAEVQPRSYANTNWKMSDSESSSMACLPNSRCKQTVESENRTSGSQTFIESESECSNQPPSKSTIQFPNDKTLIPGYTLASLVPEFDLLSVAITPTFLKEDAVAPHIQEKSFGSTGTQIPRSPGPPAQATRTSISSSNLDPAQVSATCSSSLPNTSHSKITKTPLSAPNAKGFNIQAEHPNGGVSSTTHITSTDGSGSNRVSTMSVSSNNGQPGSGTKMMEIRTTGTASTSAVSVKK